MQKTPGNSPAAREKFWTKIIIEARKYPKGVTEYCRIMNVSKNNYYFWFKRLRPKHPEWHDLSNHPEALLPTKDFDGSEKGNGDPSSEVSPRSQRRKWNATDRERILEETDGLSGGDLSALMRREGVHSHTLNKWRTERDLKSIAKSKALKIPNPLTAENKKLREEVNRLEKKLQKANDIIMLQKKISEMLTITLDGTEETSP